MENKKYIAFYENKALCDSMSLEMAKQVAHDKILTLEGDEWMYVWVKNVDDFYDQWYWSDKNKRFEKNGDPKK